MRNPYRVFKEIFPDPRLVTGAVVAVDEASGTATVELPGGVHAQVRGSAPVDAQVWVRNGVIEGEAGDFETVVIEV